MKSFRRTIIVVQNARFAAEKIGIFAVISGQNRNFEHR